MRRCVHDCGRRLTWRWRADGTREPDARPASLVDTGLLDDIKRFGAADVSACFSCGTCTAICPLSDNDGAFPRKIIRYGQVGMKDALVFEQGAVDLLPMRFVL